MSANIVKSVNDLATKTLSFSRTNSNKAKVLKVIQKNLKIFKLHLKRNYHVGVKNCLLSAIATTKTLEETIKRSVNVVNINHGNLHRISWSNMESAFSDRIRTGCINNLTHIDPRYFFNDAKSLFIKKVEHCLGHFTFIKIW